MGARQIERLYENEWLDRVQFDACDQWYLDWLLVHGRHAPRCVDRSGDGGSVSGDRDGGNAGYVDAKERFGRGNRALCQYGPLMRAIVIEDKSVSRAMGEAGYAHQNGHHVIRLCAQILVGAYGFDVTSIGRARDELDLTLVTEKA